MPRFPRIHLEGAIFYVVAQSARGEELFKEKADYMAYLELVKKCKTEHPFKLFSYCLQKDRIQLLIEPVQDSTISDIMHELSSKYTKLFNARHGRKGQLFESRFRSVLVEKAAHLLEMTRFIHLSPASDAFAYPYSSLALYRGSRTQQDGLPAAMTDFDQDVREAMDFLAAKDDPASYEKYCLSGGEEVAELEKKLRRGSILGSETFADTVRSRAKERAQRREETVTGSPAHSRGVFILAGAIVVLATASAVYLYVSKASLEHKYQALLRLKESEFAEKTRFENLSPIASSDVEGTVWEIELLPAGGSPSDIVRDRVHFVQGRVRSEHFEPMGFSGTNYSQSVQPDGMNVWETIQWNASGASLSWRGDWKGEAMKGVVSLRLEGQDSQDFSFFSVSRNRADGSVEEAR